MKNAVIFIQLALLLSASIICGSCEREGHFSPAKKIDLVYTMTSNGPVPLQDFTWKNNRLESITYYFDVTDTSHHFTYFFTYKNGQLDFIKRIQDLQETHYYFHYDKSGRYLETVDAYIQLTQHQSEPNTMPYAKWQFSHDEKHRVSGYTCEQYYEYKLNDGGFDTFMSNFILDPHSTTPIPLEQNKGNNYKKYTTTFKYEGDNIVEVTEQLPSTSLVYKYTYIPYENPFYGFSFMCLLAPNPYAIHDGYYQNLVSESTCTYISASLNHLRTSTHFDYEFEDGYPKKVTKTLVEHNTDGTDHSRVNTYYYEYVK